MCLYTYMGTYIDLAWYMYMLPHVITKRATLHREPCLHKTARADLEP